MSTSSPFTTLVLIVDHLGATTCHLMTQGYGITDDTGDVVRLRAKVAALPEVFITTDPQHLISLGLLDERAREFAATFPNAPIIRTTDKHGALNVIDQRRSA